MLTMYIKARNFVEGVRDENGQDLVEYALLAAVIVAVGAATLPDIGTKVASIFTAVKTAIGA
jgi:Flp pilus assembly pilin Flp